MAGENRLEILCVFGGYLFLYELQDRGFAEAEEGFLELLVRPVIEEAEGTSAGSGIVDYLSYKAFVFAEIKFVAYTDFAGRVHDNVPEPLLLCKFAEEEHLDIGAGFLLFAVEPCREYLGVVEDEGVALSKVIDNVLELLMLDFAGILVYYHKAAFVAPSGGFCGYLFGSQVEIELGQFHYSSFSLAGPFP